MQWVTTYRQDCSSLEWLIILSLCCCSRLRWWNANGCLIFWYMLIIAMKERGSGVNWQTPSDRSLFLPMNLKQIVRRGLLIMCTMLDLMGVFHSICMGITFSKSILNHSADGRICHIKHWSNQQWKVGKRRRKGSVNWEFRVMMVISLYECNGNGHLGQGFDSGDGNWSHHGMV